MDLIEKALTGLAMGVGWATVGYFSKEQVGGRPKFDPKKFTVTVLLGGAVGVYSEFTGMPFADALDTAFIMFGEYGPVAGTIIGGGVIAMIEKGFKALYRNAKRSVEKLKE